MTQQSPRASAWFWSLTALLLTLLFAGCGSNPQRPPPTTAPDDMGGTDLRVPFPERTDTGGGTLPALDPPLEAPPDSDAANAGSASRQATQTASYALLQRSREAEDSGNRAAAIAYLERALRLSPRAPQLWIELGRLQLPGAPIAAQRYARKALALTTPDTEDFQQAWLLIADAKELDGDRTSAEAIRDRFRTGTG